MWPSGGSRAVSLPSTCFDWALVAGKLRATSDIYVHIFNNSQQNKTTNHRLKSWKAAINSSARIRMMISWLYRQAKWSPSPRRFHIRKESKEGTLPRLPASSMISRSESWSVVSTSWVRLKITCSLWSKGLKVSNLPGRAHLSKRHSLASRCDSKVKVKRIIHHNQK